MRFVVNENVTATVIAGLRQRGHDVLSVKESMRSDGDRDTDNARILEALESQSDWAGHFSVVTDDRIRVRPLPSLPAKAEEP